MTQHQDPGYDPRQAHTTRPASSSAAGWGWAIGLIALVAIVLIAWAVWPEGEGTAVGSAETPGTSVAIDGGAAVPPAANTPTAGEAQIAGLRQAPTTGPSESLATLLKSPGDYQQKAVTTDGYVSNIVNNSAFVLAPKNALNNPQSGMDQRLLVIADAPISPAPATGQHFRVTGTFQNFDQVKSVQNSSADWDTALLKQYQGKLAIIAGNVSLAAGE